jgi:polysaccharide deacetylase family sporulation protein PdaB
VRILTLPYRLLRRLLGGLLLAALLAVVGTALHQVERPVSALPAQDLYTLRGVITSRRALALTFDISWGTVMPPKVLAILVRDHVPATFFLSGPWAEKNPEFVRELVRDGMQVESHGWAHVNYSGLSYNGVVQNIMKTDTVLHQLTGQRITFVRPPNGDFNRQALQAAHSVGYTVVTWGTDSLDWMNPGVDTIIRRVVTRAHPGDIVLLHASDTCKQTDLALPTIIRDLRAQHYELVTLSTLMAMGQPDYRG